MSLLIFVMVCAAVLLVLWSLHLRFWHGRLSVPMPYDQQTHLTLSDGGQIELRRVRALGVESSLPPVLLVHGIAVSHRNNDALPQSSFARFLSEQGRDVWLLTLRSGLPAVRRGRRLRHFTAMRDLDLPVAVAHVLEETGHSQLDIVAYSMGGMVLFAALGKTLAPDCVRRALMFASPGIIPRLGPVSLVRYVPRSLTPTVPLRIAMRSLAFALAILPRRATAIFYNRVNVPSDVARLSMFNIFEDIPGELGADFVRWAADGGTFTLDGAPVLDGLHKLDVPACFFAGSADLLAPPYSVRAAFDAWGKDREECEKTLVFLSKDHGAKHDYGHGDFAIGTHARDEVFEPAARFLNEGRASLLEFAPHARASLQALASVA